MLSSFFLNPWMLIGLTAVVIPPIIHLLNRRRYEVVDWGAMQFLQVSEVTRRRLFIEELLLMLLRMGLIAVLVLALAGPFITSSPIAKLGSRNNRDVVLVFDGSYSMGSTGKEGVPHEKAKEWAKAFVADLTPGDTRGHAASERTGRAGTQPNRATISSASRSRSANCRRRAGGCDWRPALQAAAAILSRSQRAEREIILLSDGQRFGWADRDSQFRWSLLASELGLDRAEPPAGQIRPRFWVVNVAADRNADPPNWSLTPLESNRPIVPVEREVTFRTAMDLHGQKAYTPPHRVRLEIDGQFVRDLAVPNRGGDCRMAGCRSRSRIASPHRGRISSACSSKPIRRRKNGQRNTRSRMKCRATIGRTSPSRSCRRCRCCLSMAITSPAPKRRGSDFCGMPWHRPDPTPVVRVRAYPRASSIPLCWRQASRTTRRAIAARATDPANVARLTGRSRRRSDNSSPTAAAYW